MWFRQLLRATDGFRPPAYTARAFAAKNNGSGGGSLADLAIGSFTADRHARVSHPTVRLLTAGIVAGPLFLVLWALQAFTRDGFDPGRHPISLLSLGDLGWIQIANFVVTGALFVACAVGLRRVLHPGRDDEIGRAHV